MNSTEILEWLESELFGFPERSSGADAKRRFLRIVKPLINSSNNEEKENLYTALSDWLNSGNVVKTNLAMDIAEHYNLFILKPTINNLMNKIERGEVFKPYYNEGYKKQAANISDPPPKQERLIPRSKLRGIGPP